MMVLWYNVQCIYDIICILYVYEYGCIYVIMCVTWLYIVVCYMCYTCVVLCEIVVVVVALWLCDDIEYECMISV